MIWKYVSCAIILSLVAATTGCGEKSLAAVHGMVTFGGKPVASGTLIFSPIAESEDHKPGKSSTGDIQSDGSYVLSTHKAHDGAYIGRHRVRFVPSIDDHSKKRATEDYAALALPADYVVEVKSGTDNELNVELVKRPPL